MDIDAPERNALREFSFTDRDFARVRALIHARAGISLADSKRDMVYSRLSRRLRATGRTSFAAYLDALEADGGDEWEAFTNALTTNLTSFFREAHHFDTLAAHLRARPGRRLRIWCCAASTGEEPWTLALTACEAFNTLAPPVEILATDIDTAVLQTAVRGVYPLERLKGVSPERQKRFFQRGAGANAGLCRVKPELRALVRFAQLNLLAPRYEVDGPFDAIFCRNVMIYFDKPTQREVLTRLVPHMADDGLFFAGHSESFFHAADLLTLTGHTVYRRAGAGGRAA
ncbi:CheR family methyltransferase [Coralloluteibacterium stylophorae]|uniref:Chemotaxis protein methyltransferase n=1 Tax=Coralloluteibacterium stylophorae TaxID=1776034 RepID=A0AAP2CBE0_9GAMM|nr:CheR family methyltransferase [Coralloluteibacterium stylophorae]MBS7457264.1 chemotaxis protein CheR [Coralloluteibacterium stylophorae]